MFEAVEFVDVGVLGAEDVAVCGALCAVLQEFFFVFCGEDVIDGGFHLLEFGEGLGGCPFTPCGV
jgi:hypothetical protein